VILILEAICVVLFTTFITFRVMGANYEAAVLVAGQCGFGLGATPTAIANMQAICLLLAHS
jgi:ESS family glutamate:Na+ symporter